MKVLLTYSGTDEGFQNFESVPSGGIIAVYSALPKEQRKETHFLDGNLVSFDYISKWIEREKPAIVGIGALTFGYQNAIKIGEVAKDNGAVVVLGGKHATEFGKNIVRNMIEGKRPFDYLIYGNGELLFRESVSEYSRTGTITPRANLFSRETKSFDIISGKKSGFDTDFPVLDYSLLTKESAPEKYMEKLGKIGVLENVSISMPIITQRGCAYMGEKNHCGFCPVERVNTKIPYDVFEKSLENLLNMTGADHLWITDGDFTANIKHVERVHESVAKVKERTGKDFVIYCFTRSDELLREGTIDELYALGVRAVFIGYEHGNDEMLKKMKKNTTRKQNLEATQRLAERGIEVTCGGIVLGTAGETHKTLDDTISLAEELSSIGNVRSIFASPVYPFPDAPLWPGFLNAVQKVYPKLSNEIRNIDIVEEEELVRLFQEVSHLMPEGAKEDEKPSFEEIIKTKEQINNLLGKGIQFTDSY